MRGSIAKRGAVYYVTIELVRDPVTGKRRQLRRKAGATRKSAEELRTRLLSQLDQGGGVSSQQTVAEWLTHWLESIKGRVAPRTHERYEEIVNLHLIPALGSVRLSKLTAPHLSAYYRDALETGRIDGAGGLSARTVYHHHRCLSAALAVALRQHLIPYNVATEVDPPAARRSQVLSLDPETAARVLEELHGTRWYLPVLLALTTGMRRGDVAALQWGDIDLDRGTITVQRSVQVHNKTLSLKAPKSGRGRYLALDVAVVDELRRVKSETADTRREAQVFPGEGGGLMHPDSLTHAVGRLSKRLGIPIHFHMLRHSHATLLLLAGVHPKIVSARLGHSQVGITLDTYSHVLPGMDEDAAKRFGQVVKMPGKRVME